MAAEDTQPTLLDFITAALSPALIMGLIGALIFFLIDLCYAGQYSGQMQWVMFFYVFGVVLTARMSMLLSLGRSLIYAGILGAATLMALQTYVEFPPLVPHQLHFVISVFLIVLCTWCAYMLVRDCTALEDRADAARGALHRSAHGAATRGP